MKLLTIVKGKELSFKDVMKLSELRSNNEMWFLLSESFEENLEIFDVSKILLSSLVVVGFPNQSSTDLNEVAWKAAKREWFKNMNYKGIVSLAKEYIKCLKIASENALLGNNSSKFRKSLMEVKFLEEKEFKDFDKIFVFGQANKNFQRFIRSFGCERLEVIKESL